MLLACGPVFADAVTEKESYRQLYDAGVKAAKKDYCPMPLGIPSFIVGIGLPIVGPVFFGVMVRFPRPDVPDRHTQQLLGVDKQEFNRGYQDKKSSLRFRNALISGWIGSALIIPIVVYWIRNYHGAGQ